MTATTAPTAPTTAAAPVMPRRSVGWGRRSVAAALVALVVAAVVHADAVRRADARVLRPIVELLTPGRALAVDQIIYYDLGTGRPARGMALTAMCSTAVLLVPLVLLAALALLTGRFSVRRVLPALLASAALTVVVNGLRLAMIGQARIHWGRQGFDVAHNLVAALGALAGFALAALVLVRLASRP